MFTEKHFLNSINGEELDAYLENGWYRLGQVVFTCHFIFFEEKLYSPIWIRLPLHDYRFRKSLRKIKQKVEGSFKVMVKPAKITPAKERLYQKYRNNFNGIIAPTLVNGLQDEHQVNIFNSLNVEVYHGRKLIAFSFFDVGENSLAGINGIYDPAYSNYSLGLYTMLREIQYGQEEGFRFYYPGYIVPGYERFDYKLRIGKRDEVEFYSLRAGSWMKFSNFENSFVPVEMLSKKLTEVGWELSKNDISCQLLFYPAYDAKVFGYEGERFLESPLFLNVFNDIFPRPRFIVFYDIRKEKFVFCHCMPLEDLGFYFEHSMQFDNKEAKHFLDLIMKKSRIVESKNCDEIVELACSVFSLIKKPKKVIGFPK